MRRNPVDTVEQALLADGVSPERLYPCDFDRAYRSRPGKEEPERNGLALNPTKADDAAFDECVAEIYHRQMELRRQEQSTVRD